MDNSENGLNINLIQSSEFHRNHGNELGQEDSSDQNEKVTSRAKKLNGQCNEGHDNPSRIDSNHNTSAGKNMFLLSQDALTEKVNTNQPLVNHGKKVFYDDRSSQHVDVRYHKNKSDKSGDQRNYEKPNKNERVGQFSRLASNYEERNKATHSDDEAVDEVYDISSLDSYSSSGQSEEVPWSQSVTPNGETLYLETAARPLQNILNSPVSILRQQPQQQPMKVESPVRSRVSKLLRHKRKSGSEVKRVKQPVAVKFSDVAGGPSREVTLNIVPGRQNLGRRATMAEKLFGIILGPVHSEALTDRRILVQGLLAGGEAFASGQVKIGDWLSAINQHQVNLDDIEAVLATITEPQEVVLRLQSLSVVPDALAATGAVEDSPSKDLVRLLNDSSISADNPLLSSPALRGLNFSAVFLKLGLSCESDEDDLKYEFSCGGDSVVPAIRGVFSTLVQLLPEISLNPTRTTSFHHLGVLHHVAYARENQGLLLISICSRRLNLHQLCKVCKDVFRVLKLMYGSLHSAFTQPANHSRLDQLFAIQAHAIASFSPLKLLATSQINIPHSLQVPIDDVLNEYESCSFSFDLDIGLRRKYTVLGSSLFYRGHVVSSHLPDSDLQDVTALLHAHGLLTLSGNNQLSQLVLWREVFPWRRCHKQDTPSEPGFSEPEARWFFLTVGAKNCLHSSLLEAGGCSAWAVGTPAPDPFYVDRAFSVVEQLEDMDLLAHCDAFLLSAAVPSLVSADSFMSAARDNLARTRIGGRMLSAGKLTLVDRSESDPESFASPESWGRRLSAGSDESGGSSSSGYLRRRGGLLDTSGKSVKQQVGFGGELLGTPVKLTSGCHNTLFSYVNFHSLRGILIMATEENLAPLLSKLHTSLLDNFERAALHIHHMLSKTPKLDANADFADDCLHPVHEHGILFRIEDSSNKKISFCYWVVGRVFSDPAQEFYVCFHDSAQQNVIEMAFKFLFGC